VKSLAVRRLFSHHIPAWTAGALLACLNAHADVNLTTIHTFNPDSDGNAPFAALVEGADGKLYGVNSTGGRSDNGTIFRLATSGGDFTVLNTFTQSNQGYMPEGGIVQASDGNFYGTTSQGGNNGYGTLYQVLPSTGKLNILAAFANGDPGANPVGALIQGLDGFLYGTAEYGGADSYGTVFRADISTGTTTALAEIEGGSAGTNPESDLIQGSDGNFYGTTSQGGKDSLGTFFQITPGGDYTTLYTFSGSTDGGTPLRGVVQGNDGAFYGIANAGGLGGAGVIFRIALSGTTATLTPIYSFQPTLGDGTNALGQLTLASDGNFYGTTSQGGAYSDGTIFRVTPAGGFETIYNFTDGTDAGDPISGVTQASDGNLYGTTAGESDTNGTVYSINLGLPLPAPAIRLFTPAVASAGDTIAIQGQHLVGATAVNFSGTNGNQVAAASFNVASENFVSAVVPDGAATGSITVTANGLPATSVSALTIAGAGGPTPTPSPTPTPTPVEETTVTVIATDPIAAFEGNNTGRFRIMRTGGKDTKPLTVIIGLGPKSTAVRGVDFNFATQGETLARVTDSITIPAGERSVGLAVVPIDTKAKSRPDKIVVLNLKAGAHYKLGTTIKAKVSIAGYTDK
jgi:uncharacterized repeat protein (TIGR03803 family)